MRAVVQRVSEARVRVDGEVVGEIGRGFLVLLGVETEDKAADATYLAEKCIGLRVFEDDAGKMNKALADVGGSLLAVSQFTLYGDCRKGRRPSFIAAAEPAHAEAMYEEFIRVVADSGITTARGKFRAEMAVELINDGPVTLLLDSRKSF